MMEFSDSGSSQYDAFIADTYCGALDTLPVILLRTSDWAVCKPMAEYGIDTTGK